jgi:chorismate-pyruvate lyase
MPEESAVPLAPLVTFYRRAGIAPPAVTVIGGDEMPEPYRQLLVHENDMTPTLEDYHGDRIHLQVLEAVEAENVLTRQVTLVLDESDRGVEYGAISIDLDAFPAKARELLRGNYLPLGRILMDESIAHFSNPNCYFTVPADGMIAAALKVEVGLTLYGRCNVIANDDRPLAEIVEVLPLGE